VTIETTLTWRGNMRFVRDILTRANPVEIQRAVIYPWRRWVLTERIPYMYQAKGAIPSEQPRWAKLSEWTYAQKGPDRNLVMLSANKFLGTSMMRSYQLQVLSEGGNNFRLRLFNTARSRSKWSPGFDYPSVLHTGSSPYSVRPRPDGPGRMRIPFLGSFRMEGSKTVFHAGRAGKARKPRGAKTWDQFSMYRMETHPTGAPPRPHIKFYRVDALELAQRTINWCMDKRTTA